MVWESIKRRKPVMGLLDRRIGKLIRGASAPTRGGLSAWKVRTAGCLATNREPMDDLFAVLMLLSIVGLIAGLIRPSWFKMPSRKMVGGVFGGATIAFFIFFGITAPPSQEAAHVADAASSTPEASKTSEQPVTVANTAPQPQAKPDNSKTDAQKELDEIMALAIKARFAKSYEFSKYDNVVYADTAWYTQTVSFKRDFIAKVGTLKKIITGYYHFEVRDAYSDEKVGEYTAFLGAVEVYK